MGAIELKPGFPRYLLGLTFLLSFAVSVAPGFAAPCPDQLSSPLTFSEIRSAIDSCSITTLGELLTRLPPENRKRYALVYDSRSLQQATPENPRVISYGTDASLILAFVGDPNALGYDILETAEFDHAKARFIFREIKFPSEEPGHLANAPSKPAISEDNPALCLGCHQKDPRPNWDDYFFWPGTFGAEDEGIFDLTHPAAASAFPIERALFAKFNSKAGRYADLGPFQTPGPSPSGFPPIIDYTSQGRHNLGLTTLVGALNGERIARIIAETPGVSSYRYLLLAATTCTPQDPDASANFQDWTDLTTYVPATLQKSFPLSQTQTVQTLDQIARQSFLNRIQRHFSILGISVAENSRVEDMYKNTHSNPDPNLHDYGDSPNSDDFHISNIMWALQPLHLSMSGWSTEFVQAGDESLSFHMISSELGGAQKPLWLRFLDSTADADLEPAFQKAVQNGSDYNSVYFDPKDLPIVCNSLRIKSLAALQSLTSGF